MGHDGHHSDHRVSAAPSRARRGLEPAPVAGSYDLADIGYEAADPSLQASFWREAMHRHPAGRERR